MQEPRDEQGPGGQENDRRGDKGRGAVAPKAWGLLLAGFRLRWHVGPSRDGGGELAWSGLRDAVVLCRAQLPAGEFFRFFAFSLQAGAPLRGPLPVLTFLLLADAFLGGQFFQLAGEFFRRAFLFLLSLFLGRALLLYEFLCGAFPLLLGRAFALRGTLALGGAFLPGGAFALLSDQAFLHLAGPLLPGPVPCGAFFLLAGALLRGTFFFLPGSFFGGAFFLLAGALLRDPFLLQPGALLL